MKRIPISILILFIAAGSHFSQSYDKLFPYLRGWDTEPWETVYTPDNLWDLINGAADGYLAYDFVNLHIADYIHDESETVITVELYRHSTSRNAYGIYTAERSPDYHFIDVGLEAYQEEGILNFLTGCYYVKILSNQTDEQSAKALLKIAKAVNQKLDQKNEWPELAQHFPECYAIAHSDHFIASNFIGYSFMPPAFEKQYYEKTPFQVFILDAGDEENAVDLLDQYKKSIGAEHVTADEPDGYIHFNDPYNGSILMRQINGAITGARDISEDAPVMEVLNRLEKSMKRGN